MRRENGFVRNKAMDLPPVDKMDPRPTLNVTNLNPSRSLVSGRKRRLRRILRVNGISKMDAAILARYRRKQRRLWGNTVEDPDPYDPDYIFYCLDRINED